MNNSSERDRPPRNAFGLASASKGVLLSLMLALSLIYPAYQLAPITKRFVPVKRLVKAKLRNETFTCNALTGHSDYNICINSDMTVSCNCQDFSGRGQIGDLRQHTLDEVFAGPVVRGFMKQLANRQFPTDVCPICPELQSVSADAVNGKELTGSSPSRGIMIENTALCNLACDLCRRDELFGNRRQKSLSVDDMSKVARAVRDAAIECVYFFNLGEPFIPRGVLEQIQCLRSLNPDIRIVTSTNGMLLDADEKLEAALLTDYIYFSLDGVDQKTVEKYQVGGSFERTYRNMARLVELRNKRPRLNEGVALPIIEWKYVTFRHNDRPKQVRQAVELGRQAGVDVLGFYRGAAPLPKRSLRFGRDPVFAEVGTRHGEGIIVNFGNIAEHLLGP